MINGERCSVFRRSLLQNGCQVTVQGRDIAFVCDPCANADVTALCVGPRCPQVPAFRHEPSHAGKNARAWQKTEKQQNNRKNENPACDAEAVRSRRVHTRLAANGPDSQA
jgi:hypothetical protein